MHWRRGLISSLMATRKEHWYQSVLMLLFASIGGLAPLWLNAVFLVLMGKPVALVEFASNGEFALYCAAGVAPTLYLILHERTPARLDGQTVLTLAAVVILLLSVVAYAFVIPTQSHFSTIVAGKREFFASATALLFLVGAAFSFLVAALDLSRTAPAVREIIESEKRELREEFDKLGDN